MILQEREQIIHVDKSHELQKYTIKYALLTAQNRYTYAKFYCGKYYISVMYNQDRTVQISSNYRNNYKFEKEINKLENMKYNIGNVVYFIWLWMNKFRKF